jgi:hypothetical protein
VHFDSIQFNSPYCGRRVTMRNNERHDGVCRAGAPSMSRFFGACCVVLQPAITFPFFSLAAKQLESFTHKIHYCYACALRIARLSSRLHHRNLRTTAKIYKKRRIRLPRRALPLPQQRQATMSIEVVTGTPLAEALHNAVQPKLAEVGWSRRLSSRRVYHPHARQWQEPEPNRL